MHIVWAKLGQADAGDNEAKLMTKLAPEWAVMLGVLHGIWHHNNFTWAQPV